MDRKKFWDIIILLAVFILIIIFPVNLLTPDVDIRLWIRIGLMSAFIVFAILFVRFTGVAHLFQGKINHRNSFLLLPLFLIAFCNLFYLTVIQKGTVGVTWDLTFILGVVHALLAAFAEEMVFRFVIQKNFRVQSKLIKILIVSAIFAACSIFSIISYWNITDPSSWGWTDLTMIAFTFYIGVCLGFLYEYTNNLFLPIIFNFFFNLINNVWITDNIIFSDGSFNIPYLINCLCFAAFGIAYLCLFYFVFTKRENR